MKAYQSMRLRLLLPGLLALVFVFAACQPPPELRDPNLLQDTSLISDEPCAAPCWRGITPGETAWSDALTIVEDDPTLSDPQTQQEENGVAVVAEFQQLDTGVACCQMYSEQGEVVDIMFLRTAPEVTLGDVLESKGEPAYLIGSPFSDDQAVMNLIFPEVPMVLYAFVEGTAGSLSEDSEIIGVLYLKQSDMDLLLQTSELQAWEGYQSFQAYEESELEITPSVTLTPTPGG
jgi:hypothetical protein